MSRHIHTELCAHYCPDYGHFPELRESPPNSEPNLSVTRLDYEYETPRARRAVAEETLVGLDELKASLQWLERTDPEDIDNFREIIGQDREFDSFKALARIRKLVEDYVRDKVEPWEEE
jgi:hypothetical protein